MSDRKEIFTRNTAILKIGDHRFVYRRDDTIGKYDHGYLMNCKFTFG